MILFRLSMLHTDNGPFYTCAIELPVSGLDRMSDLEVGVNKLDRMSDLEVGVNKLDRMSDLEVGVNKLDRMSDLEVGVNKALSSLRRPKEEAGGR
jgi:hypothetical protein